jgi:plasmid stability protein
MTSVHIRNLEPKTVGALKRLARNHRRSLQGELRAILDRAARMAPAEMAEDDLPLVTVRTGRTTPWGRDDIYGDPGR